MLMHFIKNSVLISLLICLLTGCDLPNLTPPPPPTSPLTLKPASFASLPGWNKDHQAEAFFTLQNSCRVILASKSTLPLGTEIIPINRHDWRAVCESALSLSNLSDNQARQFLEKWFQPYAVYTDNNPIGLFTGYYLPEFYGSSKKTRRFSAPLYGKPNDLITADLSAFNPKWTGVTLSGRVVNDRFIPYQTPRQAIDAGAIDGKARIIAWLDPIDRFFLQIQGSGFLIMDGHKKIFVGYSANNGSNYTAIGKILVDRGELDKATLSMTSIRAWLVAHPQQAQEIMEQDHSFVFFKILPRQQALGTAQVPLTAGRSLAIDRQYIPLNIPIWVETTVPDIHHSQQSLPLQQLFIAQDTGGAIKGAVRADLYWGAGTSAEFLASRMRESGRYWLLLPRQTP